LLTIATSYADSEAFAIRQVLKDLGHEKIYHTYPALFDEPDHCDIWVKAFKAKFEGGLHLPLKTRTGCWENTPFKSPIFCWSFVFSDAMLTKPWGVTDLPCAIFWKELLEADRNAKIILTVRDSEDNEKGKGAGRGKRGRAFSLQLLRRLS
jgi:hypothetical protein